MPAPKVFTRVTRLSTLRPFCAGSERVRLRASVFATHSSLLAGRTATKKFTVPVPGKYRVTVSEVVLISATSLSGRFGTGLSRGSSALTMSPTCGGAGRLPLVGGGWAGARLAGSSVVRLPESLKAAYTFVPSLLTARERGFSPSSGIVAVSACVARSNTRSRLFCEQETKARPFAKTTSAGSSLAASVAVTLPAATDTTLTESETSFTTHASSLETTFTDTGSTPTVFTTKSRVPSGDRQIGRVCCASKFT